ncbi:hypothetical protein, partial [Mangrovibacter yixingensis]|uniref:hypothetical protein n=1 Tax=Mangrovibacter yixingensis TaxID=1529639 RepID=UPI001CF98180
MSATQVSLTARARRGPGPPAPPLVAGKIAASRTFGLPRQASRVPLRVGFLPPVALPASMQAAPARQARLNDFEATNTTAC